MKHIAVSCIMAIWRRCLLFIDSLSGEINGEIKVIGYT